MRRIVVPVDGSDFAERALPFAVALANQARARLGLIAVRPTSFDERVFGPDTRIEEARQGLSQYVDALAERLGPVGQQLVLRHLVDGRPGPALAEWVTRERPDLVVMTTHGRGPWSRFWLGSVADHLIKSVPVPVLLIGQGEPATSTALRRILVPVDLRAGAGDLVELLGPFARLVDGELTLVHVQAPVRILGVGLGLDTPSLAQEVDRQAAAEVDVRLKAEAERLRAAGLRATCQLRLGDSPAAVVTEMARPGTFDLIALATRAPRGVARAVLGSVADKVVRAADVPVLVLPGAA